MSNEQKQPHGSACPHENIKMGWHGGHPYRFCLDCQMEIRAEQPQEGKPLTAEEYFDRNFVKFKGEYFISQNDFIRFAEQVEHATAALREELQGEKVLFDILINVAKELVAELEAVKKERDHWKAENAKQTVAFGFERHEHLKAKEQLTEVTRQRDEALRLVERAETVIKKAMPKMCRLDTFRMVHADMHHFITVVKDSRLSSGETKAVSNSCPHCASSNVIPYGTIQEWYCKNCGAQFGKSLTDKK